MLEVHLDQYKIVIIQFRVVSAKKIYDERTNL